LSHKKNQATTLIVILLLTLITNFVPLSMVKGNSQFVDQPSDYYSTIPTKTRHEYITDAWLAKQLKRYIDNNFKSIFFVFGQCFSGGFIDDLKQEFQGDGPIAILTACQWNEKSHADDDEETWFLRRFNQAIEDGVRDAWGIYELCRDYINNLSLKRRWRHPQHTQYHAQSNQGQDVADKIEVGEGKSKYAILYAGNPNCWRHYKNLAFIHWRLINILEYRDEDIFVLYGNKKLPNGDDAPDYVDFEATKKNLRNVLRELRDKMNKDESLFFWVDDHGGIKKLVLSQPHVIQPSEFWQYPFDLLRFDLRTPRQTVRPPFIEIYHDIPQSSQDAVYLNDHFIGYLSCGNSCSYLDFDPDIIGTENTITIESEESQSLTIYNVSLCAPSVPELVETPTGVGGIIVPLNKLILLAPYIGLASTILAATVVTVVYVKRIKKREQNNGQHTSTP